MLPRARWTERNPNGWTLLHYACLGDNLAAVEALLAQGLDVNAQASDGSTPACWASSHTQPQTLEVLCARGAALRAINHHNEAPLDLALLSSRCTGADDCVRVLLANGVRLNTALEDRHDLITPELAAFERGVLHCRAAVVAMLRVKRAGKLSHWDKFLLALIARDMWMTRHMQEWQTPRCSALVQHMRSLLSNISCGRCAAGVRHTGHSNE